MIPHAEPELAVALRSSSITCDRGEKNVNVSGKTQRGGGRGARRETESYAGIFGERTLIRTGCAGCRILSLRRARACTHLTETVTLEVVLDEADEPRRAAKSA